MINYFYIFLAFLLVLLNAFFVAAEFSMVKLRTTRVAFIKETFGLRGKILAHIHGHLDAYLSACQLGITFASLGLGWIGEPAFAFLLEPVFQFFNISPDFVAPISFIVAFSIISFLHIVIGELMPKSLAIRQSEVTSIWTAIPLYGFYWVMYPAIWLLNQCSNFLLRVLGLSEFSKGEHFYSTDEIKLLLNASHLHGELTQEEVYILEHTLDFADLKVTEAMRSKDEMVMLNLQNPVEKNMDTMVAGRHSRYPVYDGKNKEITGIIHVKDIFAHIYNKGGIQDLRPLIRPVIKISSRTLAIDLLHKFREGTSHFALIYSGPKTLLGFSTLDNLLHIIIGRIKDEFHTTQIDWTVHEDGSITIKGDASIYSLEQALDIDIEADEDHIETLAGLIFQQTERLPKVGEKIEFPQFDAVIEKMKRSKIISVIIYPKPKKLED